MSVNRFNVEGYFDSTAYEAMSAVAKEERSQKVFRPIVYICSPYAGNIELNVSMARRYSRFAADNGCIPFAPHLLFSQFLDDSNHEERKLGLFFGNVLMSKCSEIWVFGEHISNGMDSEIKRAKRKNYRIRYFTEDLEEVLG